MQRVNREDMLRSLESVQPGLSPKDTIEQSSCFAFLNGRVHTFNTAVYCQATTGLGDEFVGAVHAKPLLTTFRKLTTEDVWVWTGDGHFTVSDKPKPPPPEPGKRRKREKGTTNTVNVRIMAEIALPLDQIKSPTEWKELHESFSDAVSLVQDCCGSDTKEAFMLTCVHVHPKFVEASDSIQAARYRLPTGVTTPTLVERAGMKHVAESGVSQVGETESWVHFRSDHGFVIAVRRNAADQYRKMGAYFDDEGTLPVTLPKMLAEAVDLTEMFSAESGEGNRLVIALTEEGMTVNGKGNSGYAEVDKEAQYVGPDVLFTLPPKVLKAIGERSTACKLRSDRLLIDGGNWRYVSALGTVEGK